MTTGEVIPGSGAPEGTGHHLTMQDDDWRTTWSAHFTRTVAAELRSGVGSGALTWSEADELLARMRVLLDQALDLSPHPG